MSSSILFSPSLALRGLFKGSSREGLLRPDAVRASSSLSSIVGELTSFLASSSVLGRSEDPAACSLNRCFHGQPPSGLLVLEPEKIVVYAAAVVWLRCLVRSRWMASAVMTLLGWSFRLLTGLNLSALVLKLLLAIDRASVSSPVKAEWVESWHRSLVLTVGCLTSLVLQVPRPHAAMTDPLSQGKKWLPRGSLNNTRLLRRLCSAKHLGESFDDTLMRRIQVLHASLASPREV
ncbi:hypothetical protein KC335_g146 [Hortaea werneckii]|nr:hypothetical protein KC335_g146 [Hortaea werneckii]